MLQKLRPVLLSLALWGITGAAQAAIVVSFGPMLQLANNVEVPVQIAGLGTGDAPALSGFDLALQFDPTHLAYLGATFGDPTLGDQLDVAGLGINPAAAELVSPGVVNLAEVSFDSAEDLNPFQADAFTLVTLQFQSLKNDTSALALALNAPLIDADANPLTAGLAGGSVTTVPVPAAAWLFGSALVAFASRFRRLVV